MNCLLLREVPFPLAVRLWDTYVAEGGRMKEFLTYVLAAFLLCWAPQLRAMDFQARWALRFNVSALWGCYRNQGVDNARLSRHDIFQTRWPPVWRDRCCHKQGAPARKAVCFSSEAQQMQL